VPGLFIDYRELRSRGIPYTRVHLNRLIKAKLFPAPVWLSPNRCAWRLSDIEEFEDSRSTARPAMPQPSAAPRLDCNPPPLSHWPAARLEGCWTRKGAS
jgi:predicted DNA-binding transcriptional regulator AlpA